LRRHINTQLAILFLFAQVVDGQSLRQPISAVYPGLGAYSSAHSDVFSFVNNQAALAQLKNATAGIYSERRFLLAATSLYACAIAVPSTKGNFAFNLKYAGFKNFNEQQAGIAFARDLGPKVAIGMQFNYYGYRVPSYINSGTVNFEFGTILHLTDQLNAGFHLYNPLGGNFGKTGEKLATVYKMGLGYDASEKFFLSAEIVKEEAFPVNVNVGVQYEFMKQFFVRTGISTATSSAYGGVGVGWINSRLDISASYHPQLGWSPGLLLIFNFNQLPGPRENLLE